MRAPTRVPTPAAAYFVEKYCAAKTILKTKCATVKTIEYTIHGTSSAGLSCKKKKLIEICYSARCRSNIFAPYTKKISFYITLLSTYRTFKG